MKRIQPPGQPGLWTGVVSLNLLDARGCSTGALEVNVHAEDLQIRGGRWLNTVMNRDRFRRWVETAAPNDRYITAGLEWRMAEDGVAAVKFGGNCYFVAPESFDGLRTVLIHPFSKTPVPAAGVTMHPDAGAGPERRTA